MRNDTLQETLQLPWAQLRLQPFPEVAIKVLQLCKDENVQLSQISNLISSDPVFSSEVLVIVNSYLYSARQAITSILHAVVALGARRLQGLCLTVGVRSFLGRKMNDPVIHKLWQHNMATAIIAEQLAQAGYIDPDTAYTAGVLHDIGRLALGLISPAEYAALLSDHSGTPASILRCEQDLFGLDHCQVGLKLIQEWKLPDDFAATTLDHHLPRNLEAGWNLEELLKMSCKLADAAGFPAFPGCDCDPYDILLDQLPPRERDQFHPSVESLQQEVATSIRALEAA